MIHEIEYVRGGWNRVHTRYQQPYWVARHGEEAFKFADEGEARRWLALAAAEEGWDLAASRYDWYDPEIEELVKELKELAQPVAPGARYIYSLAPYALEVYVPEDDSTLPVGIPTGSRSAFIGDLTRRVEKWSAQVYG